MMGLELITESADHPKSQLFVNAIDIVILKKKKPEKITSDQVLHQPIYFQQPTIGSESTTDW